MPLYELFALARPGLARAAQADVLRRAARAVLGGGGFLTGVASHGERGLAYEIRRPGVQYKQAFAWHLGFAAPPAALAALRRTLALDDRVLRSVVLKRGLPAPRPPTTAALARRARARLQAESGKQGGVN